jgi:hypothetical protein
MNRKWLAWVAWLAAGLIVLSSLYRLVSRLLGRDPRIGALVFADDLLWVILPVFFVIPGALIVTRQPRNTIGWLMLLPALLGALPDQAFAIIDVPAPPESPSVLFYLVVWFDNWSWMLLLIPILLILQLFPTGRPLTPRWRWVIVYAAVMMLYGILVTAFDEMLTPLSYGRAWSVKNPVGFIPSSISETLFFIPWMTGLVGLVIISVTALVARYRRASNVVRTQIKWLTYACVIFAVVFTAGALGLSDVQGTISGFLQLVYTFVIMALPVSIGVAILRHRLYDIDILIRKTLVYALLTGLLGLVYFGSVVILQFLFGLLLGGQSPAAIVISTLAIAALFTPLRGRVQRFIDRRFFRQKYDTEKLLTAFSRRTREQTDLEALSTDLLDLVGETMQPEAMSLWMNGKRT